VQRPCTLTDGDLLTTGPGPIGDCVDIPESQATACRERVDPVDVDLGRARSVSLVVVRGVSSPVYVATSIDGRSWTEFGRALTEGGFVRASLTVSAAARSARYVRVNTVGEIPSEVSVW
jgi:hypothetical protein